MKLFLASASPRRRELMGKLPYDFEVYVPSFDEKEYERKLIGSGIGDIKELTLEVAKGKAKAAYLELKPRYLNEDIIIISADTIVVLDGEVFGKAQDRSKAIEMLMRLSGREHEVMSALWLFGDIESKHIIEISKVVFGDISKNLIEEYVDREQPFDKAGAYGIQDGGALFVDRIEGDYYNIMGLPIRRLYQMLLKI